MNNHVNIQMFYRATLGTRHKNRSFEGNMNYQILIVIWKQAVVNKN